MPQAVETGEGRVGTATWEFLPGFIEPGLAEAAGEAALKFMRDDALPFVKKNSYYRSSIGIWEPGTRFAHCSILQSNIAAQFGAPLVKVVEMVNEYGFKVDDDSGWGAQPLLTSMARYNAFDIHQDLVNQDRLVINLSMHRGLLLEQEGGEAVYLDQLLGDAYLLRCSESTDQSPWHAVDSRYGSSISMMFYKQP